MLYYGFQRHAYISMQRRYFIFVFQGHQVKGQGKEIPNDRRYFISLLQKGSNIVLSVIGPAHLV